MGIEPCKDNKISEIKQRRFRTPSLFCPKLNIFYPQISFNRKSVEENIGERYN